MKTIALCFNTPHMNHLGFMHRDYGKRYPGAGWMRHLADMAPKHGMRVKGPDGIFKWDDTILIQEELSISGLDLIGRGADPRVLMCLESPIFTPQFYDQAPNLKARFKHSLFFNGGTEHLYYPAFDDEDLKDPVPWSERKFMCMVSANKHYSMLGKVDSPSFEMAIKNQLHDYRYKSIGHFMGKEGFRMYGKGWPMDWDAECVDKLDTIRNYKFALCFENGQYPGYITEKIIDCFVAGVIPIYRGAKDISDYIPSGLFVDAESFDSFEEMEENLRDSRDDYAEQMIKWAQEWLRSPEGQRHNSRVFAKRILEMCE